MLFSVILGNQTEIDNTWGVETDERFDVHYVSCPSLHQKIKFGKYITASVEKEYSSANVSAYNIPAETYFSNNNKNMSLVVMKQWKNNGTDINPLDQIAYISLMTENYRILDYRLNGNVQIVQTYRKLDKYQGCAIAFNKSILDNSENGELIFIHAKDYSMNRYVTISVVIDKDNKITVEKCAIEDKGEISSLDSFYKKLVKKNGAINFKMTVPEGKLITSTYIASPEYSDLADEIASTIPNGRVLVLAEDALTSTYQDDIDELDEFTKEMIVDARVRAVTTIGIRLPKDFCRKNKILYLFDYNTKTKNVTCIKSN